METVSGLVNYKDSTPIPKQQEYTPDNIKPIANELSKFIRTKMYGADVRESLARWIDIMLAVQTYINDDETAFKVDIQNKQDGVEDRQTQVEGTMSDVLDQFKAVIANTTKDSEVSLARDSVRFGKYTVLDDRLEYIESWLAAHVPAGFNVSIKHNQNREPKVVVHYYEYAIGTEPRGFGTGPYGLGETSTQTISCNVSYPDDDTAVIHMPLAYALTGAVTYKDGYWYLIDGYKTLRFDLGYDIDDAKATAGNDSNQTSTNASGGGDVGDLGLSSYDIAVKNGFSGNVTQWLASLVGPKGDPGPTGTVDNDALTTAPAFVDLKTQVNDSAVRNQLRRVNEHLKNLTKQSITTTPELISSHYIQPSDGTLHEFPNNNYAVTDYIELPAGLMTISTTFTQRPDGASGWAIYDVNKKFIRGGQTSEINNLDDSACYIRMTDYDIYNTHAECAITFVFNNFSTLDEILMGKATFSLEMKNNSFIDMTTGVVKTGVSEPKLSTSRKRLIPEHALQIITNCTPRPYGTEGFAIYDGEGKYIQGGKLGVITSVPDGARYIAFTHYDNKPTNPTVTFIYDSHYSAQYDLINLANRKAIFTPELVRGWVGYDGSAQVSPDDKYKCSIKFMPIPLNAKKITLNCNYNLAGKAGWQIVDENGKFIRGGQTNNIIIQPEDYAIAFTNYDSSETHAGIKMICDIGVDSSDGTNINPPFEGKSFGFLGDSITHGLDPDNSTHEHTTVLPHPWANQVADTLGANMINYGVNSATVVPVDNHPTPLIEKYKEMSPDLDYVIVMGGINDAFNQIPLGKMEDRDSSTFYGGLHILYKALAQKYKRRDGKYVIVMTYPRYDALHTVREDVTFDQFTQAMRDVAGYYSIPIIDLYNDCEISPFSDDEFEYWIENDPIKHDGLHNPHPRQSAADIIADTMCRYLKSSYME